MHTVKVYSTSSCPYCIRVKAYLSEKGVSFENIDVSSDRKGLEEMTNISGQMGVPVIVVDGNIVIGFDKAKLEELLA